MILKGSYSFHAKAFSRLSMPAGRQWGKEREEYLQTEVLHIKGIVHQFAFIFFAVFAPLREKFA